MQGPTAVGTTCLRPSWPVLGQVGAGIGSRKLPPFLVLPCLEVPDRGSQSLGQHAALRLARSDRPFLFSTPCLQPRCAIGVLVRLAGSVTVFYIGLGGARYCRS
jgi:hypothetical protein